MAFDKLQALGEAKFGKIKNALMRGTPAMVLARMVQKDWGDFDGVAEKTLTQQLNRLRLQMTEGAFGEEAAKVLKETGKVDIKMLRGARLDVLGDLVALAAVQRDRVEYLWEKEKQMKMPMSSLNVVITDYRDTLLQVQKVQFDLGVDEFKGPITGVNMRGRVDTETLPDGTRRQRHLFEAVTAMEKVFEARGIAEISSVQED